MDISRIFIFIFVNIFISGCSAVHRDYFYFSSTSLDDDHEDVQRTPPIERPLDTFSPTSSLSAGQCCKVGERIGRRELPCLLDLYLTFRTANMVHKSKQKQIADSNNARRRPDTSRPSNSWNVLPTYLELGRCQQHRKVFEKCCSHRMSVPHLWMDDGLLNRPRHFF